MACIHPNPRRVGYIVPIHGPLDGPLYMGSIYTNSVGCGPGALGRVSLGARKQDAGWVVSVNG